MPLPLTERQREVLDVMHTYEKRTGSVCSLVYISRQLDVDSSTIRDHIKALHEKGWLKTAAPGPIQFPKKDPLPIPPREPEDDGGPVKRDATDLLKDVKIEKQTLPGQNVTSAVIVKNKNKTWKLRVVRSQGQITGFVVDDTL